MAFLDPVLDPVFQPLLNLSPFFAILIIALVISIIISVVYKFMTDQKKMKALKEEQKEFQKKMKDMKDQPDKVMAMQKDAMKKNMEYMKHSFKPTLVTMLPIILIFAWMSGNLAYEPIFPGETYTISATFLEEAEGLEAEIVVAEGTTLLETSDATQTIEDGQASWKLKSDEGSHILEFKVGDTIATKEVLITTELEYAEAIETYDHSDIESVQIEYNKLRPLGPSFTVPLFNWQPGWLGLYIVFSLVFSIGIRKAMGLY